MGVRGMWQVSATALIILILINLMLANAGETAWLVLSLVMLALTGFYCFKMGENLGHGACGIANTVEAARQAGDKVYAQLDRKYLAQAWSRNTGFRGVLAGALIPYAFGSIYIILTLLWRLNPALELAATIARLPAWLLTCPYWPLVMRWHEDFVTLTPDIVALLLITPFLLPLCVFCGYMQGPRLWAHTEEAMKQGRRRAKARARVGRKTASKAEKPEI